MSVEIILRLGEWPDEPDTQMMDLELRISPAHRLAVSKAIPSANEWNFNVRGAKLSEMLDQLEATLRDGVGGVGGLESFGDARAQVQEAAERRIREMRLLLGLVH